MTLGSIVEGVVDIHSHLLPGIDDGPADIDEALEMARAAAESGIATMVATPHLRADFPGVRVEEIADRCRRLGADIEAAGIPLRILSGAECSLPWTLEASDAELVQASFCGRGTDLLVETPVDVSLIEQLLYHLRLRGLRVTLAHPERSPQFQREPHRLEQLNQQGVLLQVNAGSLIAGSSVQQTATRLCREGIASVLASDAHRAARWRPITALAEGMRALGQMVGEARATWMVTNAPAAVAEGRPLPDAPNVVKPRNRLLRRWGS